MFQRIPAFGTAPPFSGAQLALSNQMIAYWTRFAATGTLDRGSPDRGGPGAPYWPRFSATRPDIRELVPAATHPQSSAKFAAAHKCACWTSIAA